MDLEHVFFFVALAEFLIIGLLINSWCDIANKYLSIKHRAIKNDVAYYEAKTGELTWIDGWNDEATKSKPLTKEK